nr:hypothetical protein [Tanacetum cinerariifolium]
MDTTIDQQVAMDEALVPHAKRLWTGRSNFYLLSDIKYKESTLQFVYDVLRLSSLFKDFLVTADVPEIYMQEFWATTTVHHHSILFKMDNKMHTVNLESFREMLHICPRLPHQLFIEPPFEEEILVFLRFLRHSGAIKRLTDVHINKLHQPWGSFAAIINKCLTEKSSGYHSLRLSQAQILWGLYHKRNVDFAYLIWEDFVYQVKHKDTKKSNEMYYPRFTKVIIHHFMSNDPSILRRNKVNWHYVRDDHMFFTIKLTKSSFDTTITPPTAAAGPRLTTSEKGKQAAKASKAKSLSALSELGMHAEEETRDEESFDRISKTPENNDDEGNCKENVGREEGYDEEEKEDTLYRDVNINQGRGIQTTQEVEDSYVTLTLVNPDGQQQSSSVSSKFVTSMLNPTPDAGMESIFKTTAQMDVRTPTSVAPLPMSAPTLTSSTISTITITQQAPLPPTTAPSTLLQDLPNFGSLFGFDNRLKTLEANFSEFIQTNQFARAVSAILVIEQHMDQQMNKAVKVAVQIQSDRLRDEAQADNDEFLKTIDENMQKIIKEQVKEQVSKILPKIEQTVNEQLEAEVLNRNLYKAFVDAYESDKIILDTYGDTVMLKRRYDDDADKDKEPSARSDRGSKRRRERKEPESTSAHKEKATRSAGKSTQGSKSRQTSASESATAEEPMQTTFEMEEPIHLEFKTGADDQPIIESSHHPEWFSQQKKPPTLDRDWNKTLLATHGSIQPWIKLLAGPTYELMKGSCKSLVELEYQLEEVYKATTDQLDWVNPEGQQYPHNLLKPLPLIPNNRCHRVIPFDHFINNNLEYLRGGASSRKYTTSVTKTKAAYYGHIKWIEDLVPRTMWIQEPIGYDKHAFWGISHWGRKCQQFYGFTVNWESARDVYSKRRIITVTELKIVEWHNYKHLDWITVRRDDDKLYKFKEGDFKRLRIQDIEDMLLLLVQGKLTNLTVEERFAFNVSLRMFTRSIVIQRRAEDLQLGVENYQKKLNLTKPDTYRSDLKRKEAYIAYSNPRGFIYQNKDKQNRLMWIDELHKFSDGTLINVRTALDDRLKWIRMKYLPHSIWRKSDKDREATMIQAIDKRLKTRRIMRSLEWFVRRRLYEGDFRMLQWTT